MNIEMLIEKRDFGNQWCIGYGEYLCGVPLWRTAVWFGEKDPEHVVAKLRDLADQIEKHHEHR